MIDGFAKKHLPQSEALYKYIAKIDFEMGDYFWFTCGGDGDNGEVFMDYFDDYFNNRLSEDGEKVNKEEALLAIVKTTGMDSIEDFKWYCENSGDIDEYWLGGVRSAFNAVEKLSDDRSEKE